jgi:putative two-component system response regulator
MMFCLGLCIELYGLSVMMGDQKRTILVIDDEEAIRKILNIHLSKEGYDVIQSPGGKDVFKTLEMSTFDLVICDFRMPDVDGLTILRHIRGSANYDTVPVIMLTGLVDVTIAVDVMRSGAFDYILKPVKKERLITTLHRAVIHKTLLEKNKRLEQENREYHLSLEEKVRERTEELKTKNVALEDAFAKLKNLNFQFVNVLAQTIEAKDKFTFGHCDRMRDICFQVAIFLNLPLEELETLLFAALLHDFGKIRIPEALLNKNGRLTEEEFNLVKTHAQIGEKILEAIPPLSHIADIIGAHHENYDGTGYPKGLKQEEIPLLARIISLVDTFDAMISDRPYRKGQPLENVLEELKKVAGAQLDPQLVSMFIDNKLYMSDGGVDA